MSQFVIPLVPNVKTIFKYSWEMSLSLCSDPTIIWFTSSHRRNIYQLQMKTLWSIFHHNNKSEIQLSGLFFFYRNMVLKCYLLRGWILLFHKDLSKNRIKQQLSKNGQGALRNLQIKNFARRGEQNLTWSTAAFASSTEQQYGLLQSDTHVFLLYWTIRQSLL